MDCVSAKMDPARARYVVWCLVSGVWCLVSGVWCLVSGVWWQIQNSWVRKSVRTRYGPWRRSNKYCEWHAGWWWNAMPGMVAKQAENLVKTRHSVNLFKNRSPPRQMSSSHCGNPTCAKLKSKSEIIFPIWGISTFQAEALPVFKTNQPDYGLFPIHETICGVLHCTPSPRLQICVTIFWDL